MGIRIKGELEGGEGVAGLYEEKSYKIDYHSAKRRKLGRGCERGGGRGVVHTEGGNKSFIIFYEQPFSIQRQ